jgi:hypothetical protein
MKIAGTVASNCKTNINYNALQTSLQPRTQALSTTRSEAHPYRINSNDLSLHCFENPTAYLDNYKTPPI